MTQSSCKRGTKSKIIPEWNSRRCEFSDVNTPLVPGIFLGCVFFIENDRRFLGKTGSLIMANRIKVVCELLVTIPLYLRASRSQSPSLLWWREWSVRVTAGIHKFCSVQVTASFFDGLSCFWFPASRGLFSPVFGRQEEKNTTCKKRPPLIGSFLDKDDIRGRDVKNLFCVQK